MAAVAGVSDRQMLLALWRTCCAARAAISLDGCPLSILAVEVCACRFKREWCCDHVVILFGVGPAYFLDKCKHVAWD